MEVYITRASAPSIPKEILTELHDMSPKVFMEWNSRVWKVDNIHGGSWEGRWEIWCELRQVSHPDAGNLLYKTDRWNTDHQCWMRKLQVYNAADGSFAPADRDLIIGLKMADSWADRLFYSSRIENPFEQEELKRVARSVESVSGGASYYRNYNNPTVGAHSSKYGRSDWRWRTR